MDQTVLFKNKNPVKIQLHQTKNLPLTQKKFILSSAHNENKWRKYFTVLTNQYQLHDLSQIIAWRYQSSSPTLKAKLLTIQHKSSFPKNCSFFVEHFFMNFAQLSNLSLPQTLYLFKKSLEGFHTLIHKFGSVLVQGESCGINQKGQCCVWLSNNPSFHEGNSFGIWDIGRVSEKLMQILRKIIKPEEEMYLKQFRECLKRKQVYSYSTIQKDLICFAFKNKILIPQKILLRKQRPTLVRQKNFKSVNFIYNTSNLSPQNKYLTMSPTAKPKVSWKYQNLQIKSAEKNKKKEEKSIEHYKSASNLKFQSQMSEVQVNDFSLSESSIQRQFNLKFQGLNSGKETIKNSLATTHVTNSKNCESFRKSNNERSQSNVESKTNDLRLEPKKNVISIVLDNTKGNLGYKSNYNFGGLVEVNKNQDWKANIERNAFSLKNSEMPSNKEKLMKSIYLDNQRIEQDEEFQNSVLKQNSWEKKFNRLVIAESEENLKESICYEDENEYIVPDIKLEKLGKFGRKIGKSIIPSDQ